MITRLKYVNDSLKFEVILSSGHEFVSGKCAQFLLIFT